MAFRTTQIGGTKASLLVITWIISGESQNLSEVRKVSHSMQPVGRTKCDNMNEMPCPLWVLNKYSYLPSLSLCLRPQVPRTGLEGHPIHLGELNQRSVKEAEQLATLSRLCLCSLAASCIIHMQRVLHIVEKRFCKEWGMLPITVGSGEFPTCFFSWVISLAHSDA